MCFFGDFFAFYFRRKARTFTRVKKFMVRYIWIFALCACPVLLSGQIGGRHTYDFLNLSPSARLASMGGVNVSTFDDDVHFGYQNPALVNDSMHRQLGLSFVNYLLDISYGYAGYSHKFDKLGNFHTGIHYVNYGTFKEADPFGNITGEFSAGDVAWIVGLSRSYKRLRYGANLKWIYSTLANGFNSMGVAVDLGGAYVSKTKLFSAGLVVKNLGTQLSTYVPGAAREPLPFEIVAGLSNKLKYMPLRFSLTFVQLEHPDLILEDPNAEIETDFNGNPIEKNQTLDRITRHVVFGGEFLLGRALRLRGGYNHLRRQELRSENRGGMAGFSLGFGLRIHRFAFDYGYAAYGLNSTFNTHQFSLLLNLGKKKTPPPTPSEP